MSESQSILRNVYDEANRALRVRGVIGAVGYNSVLTTETTTSTTYVDLATAGPAVTITVPASGIVKITWGGYQSNSAANPGSTFTSVGVTGASTITAATNEPTCSTFLTAAAASAAEFSRTFVLTGLTPGSTTFTVKYRVGAGGGGTGTFARRHLLLETLP